MSHPTSRSFRASFPTDAGRHGFRTGAWALGVPGPREALRVFHATMLDALEAASLEPEQVGITLYPEDEDLAPEHRGYARIFEDVRRVAAALAARGVQPGDRVLLVLPTSFEFVICFFAAGWLGAVPVPSYPPAALEKIETGIERIAHIGNHSGASLCVTTRELRQMIGAVGLRVKSIRRFSAVESLLEHAGANVPRDPSLSAESPCFIQYTSGSTGHPKGVLLAHRNIVSNAHAIGQAGSLGRRDVMGSWLPLYHDMGLIGGLLVPIYWRIPLALMPPTAFLMRPYRWLRMMQERRVTITAAPNFAYALCTRRVRAEERASLDLSSVRLALNGAEPVNHRTITGFLEAFEPQGFRAESMFPVYGLAECTVAVAFPPPGEPLRTRSVDRAALAMGQVVPAEGEDAMVLTCVGRPVPGHDVQVLDEHGDPVPGGEVGHIVVTGPSIMRGYFQDAEATQKVLRDGSLWTGDLGFFAAEGLYITGRAKDLIILRGKNYYAEDVERVAESVPGVRPGGSVAFAVYDDASARDSVICICETKIEGEDERKKLADQVVLAVGEGVGLTVDEVVLVDPGTLPKTSSGKRQRSLTRKMYLADELQPETISKLALVQVFARSAAGLIAVLGRQVKGKRRERDGD